GTAELDGEYAVFCSSIKSIPTVLDRKMLIVATTWSWRGVAKSLGALAVVDCRDGEPEGVSHGRERFVCAPPADRFATARKIGDRVVAGEVMGALGSTRILAPVSGVLCGLSANGARVTEKCRIVEVDPRGDPALCFGIGERPLAIANEVVRALAAQ